MSGAGDAAFEQYHVPDLDQAIYRRMASDALDKVIARESAAKRYFSANISNPIRGVIGLAAILSLSSLAGALWLFWSIDAYHPKADSILSAFVGFCAVLAAAIGWGVSAWIAHRNNRSKHTLDIVAARFAQPAFSKAFSDFNEAFVGKAISKALIADYSTSDDSAKKEGVQGLRYLVNYFEFIAVGIISGELDERIIARTLRGNLIYVYDRCAKYIYEVQGDNPRTLENFTTIRRHYQTL